MDYSPAALTISRKVDQTFAKINSALHNRRVHPTYGYTKAGILADIHRLEALAYAFEVVNVEGYDSASPNYRNLLAFHGIDLERLYDLLKRS